MARLSGLQKDVLRLYKRSLKLVASKPIVSRWTSEIQPRQHTMTDRLETSPTRCLPFSIHQETRSHWFQFISHQFRSSGLGGGLKKRDTASIEYMMRRGTKMLEQYESKAVRDVSLPQSDRRWEEGWVAKGGKQAAQREAQ